MATEMQDLLLDIRKNAQRAQKAGYLETKKELADNVWPMLEAIVEAMDARMLETEEQLVELLEVVGDQLTQDTAGYLAGAITLGQRICEEVKALELDEITRKRLMGLVAEYGKVAMEALAMISQATSDLSDEAGEVLAEVAVTEDDLGDGAEDEEGEEGEEEDTLADGVEGDR